MIRDILIKDTFTIIILSLIFIITLIRYNNREKFNSLIKIFWNNFYLKKHKNQKIQYSLFNCLLQINFIISLGLFVFVFKSIYNENGFSLNFLEYLDIIQVILTFFILKTVAELIISWLFGYKTVN